VHKLKPFISVISNSAESLTGMGIEITQRRNQPEYMALSVCFASEEKRCFCMRGLIFGRIAINQFSTLFCRLTGVRKLPCD
jgi:ABC-type taurine transport system ATPase subunit